MNAVFKYTCAVVIRNKQSEFYGSGKSVSGYQSSRAENPRRVPPPEVLDREVPRLFLLLMSSVRIQEAMAHPRDVTVTSAPMIY